MAVSHRRLKPRIRKTCERCGDPFDVLPCLSHQRFCSRACIKRPLADRFWEKVAKAGPNECWLWTGNLLNTGYGQIMITDGHPETAHRVSFALANGVPIEQPIVVMHSCDVRACVNPAHLSAGDYRLNALDMVQKGRSSKHPRPYGSQHGMALLTEAQVEEIRQSREPSRVLGPRYGVSSSTIRKARSGITWRGPKA